MPLPTPEEMAGPELGGREANEAAARYQAAFEDMRGHEARVKQLELELGGRPVCPGCGRGDTAERRDIEKVLVVARDRLAAARRRAADAYRDAAAAFAPKPKPERAPK